MTIGRKYDIGEPIVELLKKKTYTGFFLSRLRRVAVTNDPDFRAGVAYQNYQLYLTYNPTFMESLSFTDQVNVMEHEALHIIFKHVFTMEKELEKKDPYVTAMALNVAFDLSVNSYLTFSAELSEEIIVPHHYGLPPRKTWQYYLDAITDRMKKVEREMASEGGNGGGKGEGEGEQQEEGGGKGKTKEEQLEAWKNMSQSEKFDELAKGLLQQSQMQEFLDQVFDANSHSWEINEGKKLTEEERQIMEHVVDGALRDAKDACERRQGTMPGKLKDYLDKILKKKVLPWHVLLKSLIATTINPSWRPAYNRYDRRFGTYPGRKREVKSTVAIALDNSGSISSKDWNEFWAEVDRIYEVMEVEIEIIQCDTRINDHSKYRRGKIPPRSGAGGTDFRPVFDYIKSKQVNPDILVFFTDGCGPAPERPPKNYMVVWVYPSQNSWVNPISWGHQLYIKP